MKGNAFVFTFAFVGLAFSLAVVGAQSLCAKDQAVKATPKSAAKAIQAEKLRGISPNNQLTVDEAVGRISFEKTVCDLGEVGQGTKNECEFRFTNTGRGPLKITNVRRTCPPMAGTVFQLDRKEYAARRSRSS